MIIFTLLVFVVFCSVTAYSASEYSGGGGCIFDELKKQQGPLPSAIVEELPSKGKKTFLSYSQSAGDNWEPLRITVSDDDLHNPAKHCTRENINREIFIQGSPIKCSALDVLTSEATSMILKDILPRAIKLHTDRLLVKRVRGVLKVPNFEENICSHFTVPTEHRSHGVSDTDMILYVSSIPMKSSSSEKVLAWALPCAHLQNRPVAGAMNFLPHRISLTRHAVRVAAHEIAHALGFEYQKMHSLGMTKTIQVRGKSDVTIVKSVVTQNMARTQYSCSSLEGMELEDGENGKVQSHWERRNAKDELMSPFVESYDTPIIGIYSVLTLAAFEDMGHYKANFSMAESLEWGKGAGCPFLNEKCIEKGVTKFPEMFCTKGTFSEQRCTSDRIGVGRCTVSQHRKPLLAPYNYFDDDKTAGKGYLLTDHCPVIHLDSGMLCSRTDGVATMIKGSINGVGSWCLHGDALKIRKKEDDEEEVDGVCAQVKCQNGAVKVKYLGSDTFHDCPEGGSIIPSSKKFKSGKIKCPKYTEVCTVLDDGSSGMNSIVPLPFSWIKRGVHEGKATEPEESTVKPKQRRIVDGSQTEVLFTAILCIFTFTMVIHFL